MQYWNRCKARLHKQKQKQKFNNASKRLPSSCLPCRRRRTRRTSTHKISVLRNRSRIVMLGYFVGVHDLIARSLHAVACASSLICMFQNISRTNEHESTHDVQSPPHTPHRSYLWSCAIKRNHFERRNHETRCD